MRGMVLGKFMPPHHGHTYLIDFARQYVDELYVVVGTLAREPIAGSLRYQWMQELYPSLCVLHLQDENPQDPSQHPDFWKVWRQSLLRILPHSPNLVFASEGYGRRLADELDAKFVVVDPARSAFPISATEIREAPLAHWAMLPHCVRSHYALRVCIFGPESTGKTTLAKDLAEHFQTIAVPEYARAYLELLARPPRLEDMERIARGQVASEDALAGRCNRLLFCDTDALLTCSWSEALFGECDESIQTLANARHYDLYLLTDVDVPWEADRIRYLPGQRESFLERSRSSLERANRPYVRLSGSRTERLEVACQAVGKLLAAPARQRS